MIDGFIRHSLEVAREHVEHHAAVALAHNRPEPYPELCMAIGAPRPIDAMILTSDAAHDYTVAEVAKAWRQLQVGQ
ncbi:MAG: hypothetical protein QNJ94_18680 [Alphaproteobacteria bacterium]|nr:hypothetical protein [Alphaproteobacteria bacterium]